MSIEIKINGAGDVYTTMDAVLSKAQTGDVINITMTDGDILSGGVDANGKDLGVSYVVTGGTVSGNTGIAGGFVALSGLTASFTAENVLFDGNTGKITNNNGAWLGGGAVSGGTAYLGSVGPRAMFFKKCIFSNNYSAENGGAIQSMDDITVDGCQFNKNFAKSSAGGAVFIRTSSAVAKTIKNSSFTGNTAGFGGAICNFLSGGLVITNSTFTENVATTINNSYGGGGAVQLYLGDITVSGSEFIRNSANNKGGALFFSSRASGKILLSDIKFQGNTAANGGGAIFNDASANVNGVEINGGIYLLTETDTIVTNGLLKITGKNFFNASITGSGTVNVTDSEMVFGNTVGIDIAGLTFSGKNAMTFGGSAAVNFAGQDLSAVTITIDNAYFIPGETITVATGVTKVGTVNSRYYGDKFTWALNDGTLTCTTADPGVHIIALSGSEKTYYTMAAVLKDAKNGDTVTVTMNDGDIISGGVDTNGAGKAVDYVVSGGTVANNTGEAGAFIQLAGTTSTLTATGVLFANNTGTHCVNGWMGGGAISTGTVMADAKETTVTLNDCVFTGNYSADHGGAAHLMGDFYITGCEFNNNRSSGHGGALFVRQNDTTVRKMSGVSFVGNTAGISGGAIYNYLGNGLIVDGTAGRNTFTDNAAKNDGGAFLALYGGATFSAVDFTGNKAVNGGALYFAEGYNGDLICVVSDAVFTNNTATGNGGAIYNKHTKGLLIENSAFMTASDTIYNLSTVTFSGNITLNASLLGDGTYTVADGANFTIGQGVDLNGLDLSNATVTVNSTLYDGSDVTVATGVTAIGAYKLDDKELMLKVSDNKLILSKMAEIALEDEKTVTGTANNLITSGTAENFISNNTTAADNLLTTIKGGAISNALVGGAYAKFAEVGNAVIGNVELNISDLADIAGKVYAGGYLYGNAGDSGAAADAQMTVSEVNVNLTGGTVGSNLFGGVHARQNGNASVTEVNITVTDGSHSRIYAGGWAEKGAVSSVGTSTVIISGGTVDYLYGGGANADGTTTVGATTITIENSALVNTVFMSGRYGYSSVSDTVTLNYSSSSGMKRLSGVSSAGVDNATNTVVNVLSDLTADLIDYVDKFVISENCKLTANDAFYLGNRLENGETDGFTTFEITAAESGWDVISGLSLDDFDYAKFAVNGTFGTWDGNVMAIGDYTLIRSDDDKDGKYIIAITK
ncbi:MAG: hypothetical protein E7041_07045 [Lentisphaerae bacterium]|nr:hypothetical protein [Lentisphaerota bacterium]